MVLLQKIRAGFLKVSGYLVPLVQQIPPLGVYPALMTLPVLLYLALLATQFPLSIPRAVVEFLLMGLFLSPIGMLLTLGGLALVLYSAIYLVRHRKEGLVTTGPYRIMRHPQYLGFILLTLGLTAMSYKILISTFGIGWLSPEGTIALWFGQFVIYLILAFIEESYLSKVFGDQYTTYKQNSSALIPMGKLGRLEIPLSILILSGMLFASIILGTPPTFIV